MLYDLSSEPPLPGSLLESVFILMAKKRQEVQYYQTNAILTAIVAAAAKDSQGLKEAVEAYRDAIFPFLKTSRQSQDKEAKETLKRWTDMGALKVRPLWLARNKKSTALQRGTKRLQEAASARARGLLRKT